MKLTPQDRERLQRVLDAVDRNVEADRRWREEADEQRTCRESCNLTRVDGNPGTIYGWLMNGGAS